MKKNLKPIDSDINFKYRCPNLDCGYFHWLSIKEAKTKNFKVVCDCGTIFKPKLIKNIEIIYEELVEKKVESPTEEKLVVTENKIPLDLQQECVKILIGYGFTKQECLELTQKAYVKNPINNIGSFIKYIIQNLGELNEFN